MGFEVSNTLVTGNLQKFNKVKVETSTCCNVVKLPHVQSMSAFKLCFVTMTFLNVGVKSA